MPDYSAYADLTVRRVYCEDLISNGNVGFGGNIAIGGSGYSTDIDLNLESTTLNHEAWGAMDNWLRKNFINTPPAPVSTGDTADTAKISFSWTNPAQLEAGFSDIKIPRIDTLKFEYKESTSSTWLTGATMETMTTESPTITTLEMYVEGSGSGKVGTTYKYYNITSDTQYDVRIYCENKNDTFNKQYLTYTGKATLGIGPPGVPTGLGSSSQTSSSIVTSWTKPDDHDTSTAGIQTTPSIERYQLSYTPVSSVRYGGVYNTTERTTTSTSTSKTISSNVLPGTLYRIKVQAKNTQNVNYSTYSSNIEATTSNPSSDGFLNSSMCGSIVDNGTTNSYARKQDGTQVSTVILSPTTLSSSTSSEIRTNYVVASESSNICTVYSSYGINDVFTETVSKEINGFGGTSGNGTVTGTKLNIVVSNDGDTHSGTSTGFWRKCTIKSEANDLATNYPASHDKYSLISKQVVNNGGSTHTSGRIDFYIDSLSNLPVVTNLGITEGTTTVYISGVPSFTSTSTFNVQYNQTYLCNYFIRNDQKHSSIRMCSSSGGGTIGSNQNVTRTGSVQYYVSTGDHTTSSTLHNTNGTELSVDATDIQFKTYTVGIDDLSTNSYEDIHVRVIPYNLYGEGSSVYGKYVDTSSGTSSKIRADGDSINTLTYIDDSNQSTGLHVNSGTGEFPSSGYTTAFTHSTSIVSTSDLQLINGSFRTRASGGYGNYLTSYYYPSGVNGIDYSSLSSETGYRYVTFKYTNVIPSGDYGKLRVVITGASGITVNFGSTTANHKLYLKVVTDDSDYTTGWLDITKAVGGGGVTTENKSDGTRALNTGTSSSSQRDCYIISGTASNMNPIIYVRFGQQMNVSSSLKYITVTPRTTF